MRKVTHDIGRIGTGKFCVKVGFLSRVKRDKPLRVKQSTLLKNIKFRVIVSE